MATFLLIVIYITYIGLGVPDSMIGTAWPAIYPELGLPVSAVSCVTLIISGGTVVSSFLSDRIINRFGTGRITAVSTAMTAAALLGFSLSGSLLWLCLSAVPLGLGAGAIDTALNNSVALRYTATHMNFLHCFYGVGVSLSPYLMSLALSNNADWRGGYRTVFWVQLAIAVVSILTLPLWNKVKAGDEKEEEPAKTVPFRQLARMPAVRAQYGVFIGSCAIESVCLVWGGTFLVSANGLPVDYAARMVTFYYVGMALGRFLSGILTKRFSCWTLIHTGQAITLAAVLLLLLPLAWQAAVAGLFLVGLGNGALYPNMTYLTPRNFGRDISQSVIGTQMAFAYLSIMLAPPLFGALAQWAGVGLFPAFLLAMFAVMIAATALLRKRLARRDPQN